MAQGRFCALHIAKQAERDLCCKVEPGARGWLVRGGGGGTVIALPQGAKLDVREVATEAALSAVH
jgi:hypothetical protein